MDKIYLQIYSIREKLDGDFKASLKRIADMGYAGVEFAGNYGGMNEKEMKAFLADTNLEPISAHIGFDQTEAMIDYMAYLGSKFIVCPSGGVMDYDSAMRAAENLNRLGEICKKAGIMYGYHNHTGEFGVANDKYLLEIMMENTDPASVFFQLDAGWCTTAGVNAVDFINKHAGRFELIHAKEAGKVVGTEPPIDWKEVKFDENKRPIFTDEMKEKLEKYMQMNVPTGTGLIDWSLIKKTADAQGAKAYIVEREWNYKGDIFACVNEDLNYLKKI